MPASITMGPGGLRVPEEPIVPFIEGDGTGPDIWAAAVRVFDAAVARAYGGRRRLAWKEVLAGEKAFRETGEWLPAATLDAFREHLVGIKGPLTTPVGGGIRSLNVALRQILDLYACVRPVRWYRGVPSPVRHPERVDMVIFRENTEDVYAGKELEAGSAEARRLLDYLRSEFGWEIRPDSGLGVKPISETGTRRLVRAAIRYALDEGRRSVTLVHKGNIKKFTEGAFRSWGYRVAEEEFGDDRVLGGLRGPAGRAPAGQGRHRRRLPAADPHPARGVRRHRHDEPQRRLHLRRPRRPGGRHRHRPRRATSTTRPGTPSSRPPTAPPRVRRPGQGEPGVGDPLRGDDAALPRLGRGRGGIEAALEATIAAGVVTYDFARLMEGATEVRTSEFATAIIDRL